MGHVAIWWTPLNASNYTDKEKQQKSSQRSDNITRLSWYSWKCMDIGCLNGRLSDYHPYRILYTFKIPVHLNYDMPTIMYCMAMFHLLSYTMTQSVFSFFSSCRFKYVNSHCIKGMWIPRNGTHSWLFCDEPYLTAQLNPCHLDAVLSIYCDIAQKPVDRSQDYCGTRRNPKAWLCVFPPTRHAFGLDRD